MYWSRLAITVRGLESGTPRVFLSPIDQKCQNWQLTFARDPGHLQVASVVPREVA